MIGIWGDYVGYPGGAALRAAGFIGVIRYVGVGGAAKRLTAAEYADLTGHGVTVLAVVESTTTEADNGYSAGVADARAALVDLGNLGASGVPLVFATNDKSTFVQADVDYVRGFRDTLGHEHTGAYGFGDFLAAVHSAGLASAYWQAGHPPNLTGTQGFVHFWQRQGTSGNGSDGPATPTTTTVGGVSVDYNNQLLELPNMTTLDDQFQSTYVGPTGVRSPVNLTYAQALQNSDGGQYTVRQMLAGELRAQMPDGATRNVFEALENLTSRLMALTTAVTGVDTDVKAAQTEVDGRIATVIATLGGLSAGGTVNVDALAQSLAPLLNAQEGPALIAALKTQFDKP